MGLPRDIVELEEVLRLDASVDLFAPIDRGSLLESAHVNSILEHLREVGFRDPISVMQLCLQALRVQHQEMAPRLVEAELVATLPPEIPGVARTTGQVIREMLRPDMREVILVGYELTDQNMVRLLADAASRRANVIIICDRVRGAAQRLLDMWPTDVQRPRIFQDKERGDGPPHASMHAKCLLVDGKDLLVTSANFTFHGLQGNIEIGVRLSGPPVIEARKAFSHLVQGGILEEWLGPGNPES